MLDQRRSPRSGSSLDDPDEAERLCVAEPRSIVGPPAAVQRPKLGLPAALAISGERGIRVAVTTAASCSNGTPVRPQERRAVGPRAVLEQPEVLRTRPTRC